MTAGINTSRKPDESDKAKGRELARLRKAASLSQEQLAIRLGISAKQFGKYERGLNRIPAGRYEAALRILREQPDVAGFAESQASYNGPDMRRDAVLLALEQMKNDLNSFHHQMQDRLKLCCKIAGGL